MAKRGLSRGSLYTRLQDTLEFSFKKRHIRSEKCDLSHKFVPKNKNVYIIFFVCYSNSIAT